MLLVMLRCPGVGLKSVTEGHRRSACLVKAAGSSVLHVMAAAGVQQATQCVASSGLTLHSHSTTGAHQQTIRLLYGLQRQLKAAVEDYIHEGAQPTERMIRDFAACEHAYINTDHPSFIGGNRAVALVSSVDQLEAMPQAPGCPGQAVGPQGLLQILEATAVELACSACCGEP